LRFHSLGRRGVCDSFKVIRHMPGSPGLLHQPGLRHRMRPRKRASEPPPENRAPKPSNCRDCRGPQTTARPGEEEVLRGEGAEGLSGPRVTRSGETEAQQTPLPTRQLPKGTRDCRDPAAAHGWPRSPLPPAPAASATPHRRAFIDGWLYTLTNDSTKVRSLGELRPPGGGRSGPGLRGRAAL
jgi:hypothetical protein